MSRGGAVGRGAAIVTVSWMLATGCATRPESSARRIDRSTVPFGLLARDQGAGTSDLGDGVLALYYVGADRLVEVARSTPEPEGAGVALEALLDGPTDLELANGLATALPTSGIARLVDTANGTALVRLAPGFRDGTVPNQATALAQIVYTLTAVPGITAVQFSVDDQRVAVPRADGSLTERPVGPDDYAALLSTSPP